MIATYVGIVVLLLGYPSYRQHIVYLVYVTLVRENFQILSLDALLVFQAHSQGYIFVGVFFFLNYSKSPHLISNGLSRYQIFYFFTANYIESLPIAYNCC